LKSVILLVFALVLLIGSQSRTSWLVTGFLLALWPALQIFRHRSPNTLVVLAVLLFALLLAGTWMSENADSLLLAIGKDSTLTGRTVMWSNAITAGLERPWLGWGFRAFWLGEEGPAGQVAANRFMVLAGHGHNSFLDIWLGTGFVGLFLVLLLLGRTLKNLCQRIYCSQDSLGMWYPIQFLLPLLVGVASDTLLAPHGFLWMLAVATMCQAPRSRRRAEVLVEVPRQVPLAMHSVMAARSIAP
jgi:O-antigen ligase